MTTTDEGAEGVERGTDAATEDGQPLGRSVTRALGWSTLAEVLGRLGSFTVGIVLARLLTTEDFGIYATTLVALNILLVINDLGVIAAVIRWQGDVRDAARTGATLSVLFSVVIFAGTFLVAGLFSDALGSPSAAGLVRVLTLVVLIDGISGAHLAVLVRTFRNDRIAKAEFAGFLLSTPVIIGLAVAGAGAWSIVVGRVIGAAVVAFIVIRSVPFVIRPGFDRPVARRLVRFGAPLALSAVIAQAVLNVDYIVVGRSLGAVSLGIYLLAFNLSSWPTSLVSTALSRVSFAGLSRLVEDRARLHSAFPRSIGVALSVLVPLVVLLSILAPEVIEVVYGPKWSGAATPLRFLLVLGGLRIITDLLLDLSIADGRPSMALKIRLTWLVALIPTLAIGANVDGLRGVGIAHAVIALGVILPLLVLDARRSGFTGLSLFGPGQRALLAGVACAVVAGGLLQVVSGDLTRIVVVGAAGGLAYLAVLVPRNPLVPWVVQQVRPARSA